MEAYEVAEADGAVVSYDREMDEAAYGQRRSMEEKAEEALAHRIRIEAMRRAMEQDARDQRIVDTWVAAIWIVALVAGFFVSCAGAIRLVDYLRGIQ